MQKEEKFITAYVKFLKFVRSTFHSSLVVCCSSPMADAKLKIHLNSCIRKVVLRMRKAGDRRIFGFYYKNRYYAGHKSHPSKDEHIRIADELKQFLKTKGWETEKDLLDQRFID